MPSLPSDGRLGPQLGRERATPPAPGAAQDGSRLPAPWQGTRRAGASRSTQKTYNLLEPVQLLSVSFSSATAFTQA